MPKDLRTFLDLYERDHPEEVVHVDKPISLKYEIGVLIDKLERLRKSPLLIFHRPLTVKAGESKYQAVTDTPGTRSRLAYAIGSTFEKVALDTDRLARTQKRKPVVVDSKDAPAKEVIKKGSDINMYEFPAYQPYYMVAAPYISMGVYIFYDPDTGIDNAAIARGMIQSERQVGVFLSPGGHNHLNLWKYHKERKEDAKCAIAVGFHPAAYMGMGVRLGYPESHFEAAGGLLGEPMRLVPSETLGDDFLVPADAEVVIEGVIPSNERAPEGPYSEYTRHIGCQRWRPFLKVSAVTHRKDLVWPNYAIGRNHCFQGLTREVRVNSIVRQSVPQVQDVYLLPHAGGTTAWASAS
ncbi:MAG: UbiD family decarboxylase [Nitrososphaerota archaeon]|nr:UbiD family decarboxylase [Nitrososphaerota archaeon]